MKMRNLLLGFALCALFAACADDDVKVSSSAPATPDGSYCAYLTISLQDVNDGPLSRATAGDFEYGTQEQEIKNAYFYFYDENGEFVTEADVWNGGEANSNTPTENIEFKGNTVVVLEGLTSNTYPTYMLTVLNQDNDFTPASTINGLEAQLSSETGEGIYYNDGDEYFKMSTSSYDDSQAHYFLTTLETSNFELEPVSTPENPVVVYVERLAAKVTVQTTLTAATDIPDALSGKTLYELHTTVAGDENEGDEASEAYETLYVEFNGWKLNATANHSNLVKNIDATWSSDLLSELDWNDPTNYRSYWGMSFNYGLDSYPSSSEEVPTDGVTDYLTYVSLSGDLKEFGDAAYCPENTNTQEIVSGNYPSAVTHVLLSAQLYDAEGATPTLVRYSGMLFEEEQYLTYTLGTEDLKDRLDYYYKEGETLYQIDENYVELKEASDGKVYVGVTDEALEMTWYESDGSTEADINELDNNLLSEFGEVTIYNEGMMYYCIPIEHLNNPEGEDIEEGQYGVVRNHHYVVTITSLTGLGNGVYDPDEIVVPEVEEEVNLYYVGAQINVLSWKIVSQDVVL